MGWIIGTDEAGYGPNLGPCVVAATVWRVPDHLAEQDLYTVLAGGVSSRADGDRVTIADSKVLYRSKQLELLERSLLASLVACESTAASLSASGTRPALPQADGWRTLLAAVGGTAPPTPWHEHDRVVVPVANDAAAIIESGERFADTLREKGIRLVSARATVIFPESWNDLLDSYGGKGAVLTRRTLELASGHVRRVPADERVDLVCDKHGGRNRYAAELQHFFPEDWIEIVREGRADSTYRWGSSDARRTASFRVGGEAAMPCALASMLAKYLREISMLVFNAFWQRHVPGVRPTAGYPTDARRFRRDVAHAQRALGISDRLLWRNR